MHPNSPFDCPLHRNFVFWSDAMCERFEREPSYFSQEDAGVITAMCFGHDVPDLDALQDDFERLVEKYREDQEEWDFSDYEMYA